MPGSDPLGPNAQRFVDEWGPRTRLLRTALTGATVALFVTWLLGITSLRMLLIVIAARVLVAAIYGGVAGRKIASDRESS